MTGLEVALAAGWLLASVLATYGTAAYLRGLSATPIAEQGPFPPVLVLLPVRAADAAEAEGVGACLAALAAQDYPGPWRVVVALEEETDPAWRVTAAADPARFAVLRAGPTPGRAQKLHNLLAALATRRPEEGVVVTLDADARPAPSWLTDLTRPVRHGKAEAASGYRWQIGQGGLPARLVALADRSMSTLARPLGLNMVWGGSTALSAAALARMDLPRLWDGAVSDDLTLSAALRAAGMHAWMPKRVLLPTPIRHDWASLFGFGRRQYLLLRLHAPRFWLLFLAIQALPVAGALAMLAAAARGSGAALGVLAAGLVLQQARAGMRLRVARRVLPAEAAETVARGLWLDRLLLPLVVPLHLLVMLTSAAGRRIDWGGRSYLVEAPDRTRVIPPRPGG